MDAHPRVSAHGEPQRSVHQFTRRSRCLASVGFICCDPCREGAGLPAGNYKGRRQGGAVGGRSLCLRTKVGSWAAAVDRNSSGEALEPTGEMPAAPRSRAPEQQPTPREGGPLRHAVPQASTAQHRGGTPQPDGDEARGGGPEGEGKRGGRKRGGRKRACGSATADTRGGPAPRGRKRPPPPRHQLARPCTPANPAVTVGTRWGQCESVQPQGTQCGGSLNISKQNCHVAQQFHCEHVSEEGEISTAPPRPPQRIHSGQDMEAAGVPTDGRVDFNM